MEGCSGCALHEAAVQGPQGGHHGPSASPAPLSAAVLFASLLVLVEEKEAGGACFQDSWVRVFQHHLVSL